MMSDTLRTAWEDVETELAESIKVRWTGSARNRIFEFAADAGRNNSENDTQASRVADTLDRQKTNVVIRTVQEASAIVGELKAASEGGDANLNGSQANACQRVTGAVIDAMADRGHEPVTSDREFRGFEQPADTEDSEPEVMTDGGVDVDGESEPDELETPIKVRWTGDARSKFLTRGLQPTIEDGEIPNVTDVCAREKTNIVITTTTELKAVNFQLEQFINSLCNPRCGLIWATKGKQDAARRVQNEIREEMDARELTEDDDSEDREVMTDGGVDVETDANTEPGDTLADTSSGDWLALTATTADGDVDLNLYVCDNRTTRAKRSGYHTESGRLALDGEVTADTTDRLEMASQSVDLRGKEDAPGEWDDIRLEYWDPHQDADGEVVHEWTTLGTVTDAAVTADPEGESDD